jgi:thioredoxin 1
MAAVTIITKDNIKAETADGVTLIKFGAEWCGPCRQLAPIIEAMAEEITNATIGDCNIDDEQELAVEFGIRSVPTTIIFKDGEVVDTFMGVVSKTTLTEKINSFI